MGKGTIGINPFHTDRSIMSPVAVAGLLSTIIAFTDSKGCTSFTPFSLTRVRGTDEMGKKSFSINRIGCSTLS